jgi:hypothetical protein
VTTGARPGDNGVSLDLDVTRHIRLQAGVDASGGSSAGVGAEWESKESHSRIAAAAGKPNPKRTFAMALLQSDLGRFMLGATAAKSNDASRSLVTIANDSHLRHRTAAEFLGNWSGWVYGLKAGKDLANRFRA